MGLKVTSLLTGVVFGGLAAGSAVLLLTPRSGKELRDEWSTRGHDISDMFGQIMKDSLILKNEIGRASRSSARAVQQGSRGIKLSVDDWKRSTEPNVEELRSRIQQLNDQLDQLEESTKKDPSS